MAIVTKFTIIVEIDDQKLKIIASETTKRQEKEIKQVSAERDGLRKERDKLAEDLQFATGEFQVNQQLIGESGVTDKLMLLLDQKKLIGRLKTMSTDLRKTDEKLNELPDTVEESNRKRFGHMVADGPEKNELVQLVETTNLTYFRLVLEIRKLIAEAMGKQTTTS